MIFVLSLLLLNISLYASSTELYLSEENSSSIDKKIRTFADEHNYTIELKKENSIEVYFDTPKLRLSTQNAFIKYQLESLPKSKKIKKFYREEVHYLSRDKTLLTYPVKHYHTIKSIEEKHLLLSLIKRADREDFMTKLKANGIEHPLRLKYLFKISKSTQNYQLLGNKNKISIVVNQIELEPFNSNQQIVTLKILKKPLESASSVPNKTRLKPLISSFEPNLTEIENNPYLFYLNRIKSDNFYFTTEIKHPYLFRLLNTVLISLFLVLFFYIFSTLFFTIFSKKTSYLD